MLFSGDCHNLSWYITAINFDSDRGRGEQGRICYHLVSTTQTDRVAAVVLCMLLLPHNFCPIIFLKQGNYVIQGPRLASDSSSPFIRPVCGGPCKCITFVFWPAPCMVKLKVTPGRWLLPALLVVTWLSRVAADGAKHSTPGKLNVIRPGTDLTCVMSPQTKCTFRW